jgi:hypothetical protein
MSNVLIGVIGVIIFIGLALAGALFLGPRFSNSRTQADVARYMSEGSQISKAYDLHRVNEGSYPTGIKADGTVYDEDETKAKLIEMKERGYLKALPIGGSTSGTVGAWYIDSTKGAALTLIGSDTGSKNVCVEARKQIGFTDPENVLACDSPDLTDKDPCCSVG